jgi:(R)-2-hydroxyacyl-CoA dehydratese activating ATPase
VATGYGRDLIEAIRPAKTISEIKAHALGARFLCPSCRSVIDIGGQDVKVISLDASGKIAKFELNDRCSAGTGKFFEIMAEKLGYTLIEFGHDALTGKPGVTLNSQCTVFAESEIIGLLNRGCSRNDISRAIHISATNRITTMFNRIEAIGPTVITGGCSKNLALVRFIEENLDTEISNSSNSQFAGSIGCALSALV